MPGTAYVLLHHCFGEVNGKSGVWGHAVGGMGAISDAMRRSAETSGAYVRTGAPVESVLMEGDRAAGVVLAGGERRYEAALPAERCDAVRSVAVEIAVKQETLRSRVGTPQGVCARP